MIEIFSVSLATPILPTERLRQFKLCESVIISDHACAVGEHIVTTIVYTTTPRRTRSRRTSSLCDSECTTHARYSQRRALRVTTDCSCIMAISINRDCCTDVGIVHIVANNEYGFKQDFGIKTIFIRFNIVLSLVIKLNQHQKAHTNNILHFH